MQLKVAVCDCSMGLVLSARSEQGLCAIFLGDDPEVLMQELRSRFPNAPIEEAGAGSPRFMADLVGFVESPGEVDFRPPLDIHGTAFQKRVWQALREISAGQTATYSEIARAIGQPAAARAVAGACAANKLAVVIPCHRVVRADGRLSGYRWGVERKRVLLAREGAEVAKSRSLFDALPRPL